MKSVLAAVCIPLACLTLSACGSSRDDSATAASGQENQQNTAQTQLQDCLRDNGVDVQLPGSGGTNAPPPNLSAADQQKIGAALNGPCKKYQSKAFGNSGPNSQSFQDSLAKFSSCMRAHGIEIPDDVASGGGPPQLTGIDQNSPKFKTALAACQSKLPAGGPGGGAGG